MLRGLDGLRLYRPLPAVRAFHASAAKWRVIDGANRAGKTLAAAVELAAAVTGYRGITCEGAPFKPKDGRAHVIGLSEPHLAVLWRKLSKPGAYSCIYDAKSGELRAVKWDDENARMIDPEDLARRAEWVESPPLIPEHAIESVAWRKRKEGVPGTVTLVTGWTIEFIPSMGRVRQGEHVDFGWIDEAIQNDEHYYELCRGLVDFGGSGWRSRAVWSATPQVVNLRLWELRNAAEASAPDVAAFRLTLDDNPFVSEEERRRFAERLSDDGARVRIEGIPALETLRVYPQFAPRSPHVIEPFEVPANWSVYLGVDPGRQRCGTVVGVVGPREDALYITDAFVHSEGDALSWAEQVARIVRRPVVAVVMDSQAGGAHSLGQAETVAWFYMKALREAGVNVLQGGAMNGAVPGLKDVAARIENMREVLRIAAEGENAGQPRLKMFAGRTKPLIEQIAAAHSDPNRPDRRRRGNDDVLDACEYLVSFHPTYAGGIVEQVQYDSSEAVWRDFLRRRRNRLSRGGCFGTSAIEVGYGV